MNRYNSNKLYEMANLPKQDTGLKYLVWIMPKTNKEKHWARIKVEVEKGIRVPVDITDDPKWRSIKYKISSYDFNMIKKWIAINKNILLEYWNSEGEMSLKDVFSKLKKV